MAGMTTGVNAREDNEGYNRSDNHSGAVMWEQQFGNNAGAVAREQQFGNHAGVNQKFNTCVLL